MDDNYERSTNDPPNIAVLYQIKYILNFYELITNTHLYIHYEDEGYFGVIINVNINIASNWSR